MSAGTMLAKRKMQPQNATTIQDGDSSKTSRSGASAHDQAAIPATDQKQMAQAKNAFSMAEKVLGKACTELNHAKACAELAAMFEEGSVAVASGLMKPDASRATQYRAYACKLGDSASC